MSADDEERGGGGPPPFARVECGILDLRSASASILARLHTSQRSLLTCLSRAVAQGVRSSGPAARSLTLRGGAELGPHVGPCASIAARNLERNVNFVFVPPETASGGSGGGGSDGKTAAGGSKKEEESGAPPPLGGATGDAAASALYLGSMLNLLHSCLYEEKRERHVFNVVLLARLMRGEGVDEGLLADAAVDADNDGEASGDEPQQQKGEDGEAEAKAKKGGEDKAMAQDKDDDDEAEERPPAAGMFGAIRYVLKAALDDFDANATAAAAAAAAGSTASVQSDSTSSTHQRHQRVSRHVAASLPPAISLLRRLISRSLLVESQMSSVLAKMKDADLEALFGPQLLSPSPSPSPSDHDGTKKDDAAAADDAMDTDDKTTKEKKDTKGSPTPILKFDPAKFGRGVHAVAASAALELWRDDRLSRAPAHALHPILQLVGNVLGSLEASAASAAASAAATATSSSDGGAGQGGARRSGGAAASAAAAGSAAASTAQGDLFRAMNAFVARMGAGEGGGAGAGAGAGAAGAAQPPPPPPPPPFEPSEETVARLTEMGFGRDHALEALEGTESNRVEVAMEYCLMHPPPSPNTAERRRVAREERTRRRREREEEAQQAADAAAAAAAAAAESAAGAGAADGGGAAASSAGATAGAETAAAASIPLPPEGTGAASGASASDAPAAAVSAASAEGASASADTGASASADTGASASAGAGADADADAMDVAAEDDDGKPGEEGEQEKKKKADPPKPPEDPSVARLRARLRELKASIAPVSFAIIEGGSAAAAAHQEAAVAGPYAYGEPETATVAACSFLLECCERYPDLRSSVVGEALGRLKGTLESPRGKGGVGSRHHRIADGREGTFAVLAHACVILLRALPRARALVLREGLVGYLLGCVRTWSSPSSKAKAAAGGDGGGGVPHWLSPALLLLDVMAQPTSVPVEVEPSASTDKKSSGDGKSDDSGEGKVEAEVEAEAEAGKKPSKELARVANEHKKQSAHLSKAAAQIFAAVSGGDGKTVRTPSKKKKKSKEKDAKQPGQEKECEAAGSSGAGAEESSPPVPEAAAGATASLFAKIPTYQPLMPAESAEACVSLCLQVLRVCSRTGKQDTPPGNDRTVDNARGGVVHAALLLLTRVLRSHKLATLCLRLGGTELILSLPSGCRFAGNTGLVTTILRRTLEDEPTLRTAMEAEIRAAVTKLHKKQSRGSAAAAAERAAITSRSFAQAVTPLICRDPLVFIKAAATSVRLETPSSESGGSARQSTRVILLSSEERAKTTKALAELNAKTAHKEQRSAAAAAGPSGGGGASAPGGTKQSQKSGKDPSAAVTPSKRGRQAQRAKSAEKASKVSTSKSPRRSSLSRRSLSPKKGGKKEPQHNAKKLIALNGSPANHVTSLLLSEMTTSVERERQSGGAAPALPDSFLWLIDYLEIVADLILAVPACAAAIHRYRPAVKVRHALPRCHPPPNTAVSFFLHELLPQPRAGVPKRRVDATEPGANEDGERTSAYMKVKISQTTARLLVALVARAGEGRRRVIADLAFALGGTGPVWQSRRSDASASTDAEISCRRDEDHELWALQSWGELCIGIAAPRSTGISQDTNTSLSWEVVKLMLENGMANCLLSGVQRIKLHHPNASSCAGALLRPLEVFTRASVTDTMTELVKKAAEEKKAAAEKASAGGAEGKKSAKKPSSGLTRNVTMGPSQQNESAFADDAMLDDGFDAETAERTARRTARQREREAEDDFIEMEDDDDDDEMEVGEDESSVDDGSESDAISRDSMDDDDMSSDDDIEDDMSSDVDGDSMESGEEVSSESEVEDDATEEEAAEREELEADQEDETDDSHHYAGDEGGDLIDHDFERDVREEEEEGFFDGPEEEDDDDDEDMEEGEGEEPWAFFDGRNAGPAVGGRRAGRHAGRGGGNGLMVEAAEAMIGNILREGGLQMDALAEIEDTLGIRIIQRGGGRDPNGSRHAAPRPPSGDGTGVATAATVADDSLIAMNRGPIGSVPTVHQGLPPDSGYSSVSSRAGDSNPMEYLYGGPAVMSGSECYFLGASIPRDEFQYHASFPVPPAVDTQLFPGGPAASMHARSQQHIHPFLCGVELSPFNALIPAQSRQVGQAARGSRGGASDWGNSSVVTSYMSGGQVLRISRGPSGQLLESSRTAGATGGNNAIVGWTDDGQPLDNIASEFGAAFEQALSETITQSLPQEATEAPATSATPVDQSNENASGQGETAENEAGGQGGTRTNANEDNAPNPNASAATGPESSDAAGPADPEDPNEQQTTSATSTNPTAETAGEVNASEGEVVASSLATGLRLSPSSVNSATSDPMSTGQEANEAAGGDSEEAEATEQNSEPQENSGTAQNNNANQGGAAGESGGNTTADGAGDEEQQEQQTDARGGDGAESNGEEQETQSGAALVCPPGIDLEVFNSLPPDMQRELISENQASSGVAAQLDATSSLDPEALAALPEEMRREVIEQEQQERRMREETPADPSNAEEMDNASFVASLAPDLREEILLTADEVFLRSLPPDMQSEAQILRERAATSIRRRQEQAAAAAAAAAPPGGGAAGAVPRSRGTGQPASGGSGSGGAALSSSRKRQRTGKMRVECDRENVIYLPLNVEEDTGAFMTDTSMVSLVKLMYLLSPVRPQKLIQKLIQNLCVSTELRKAFISIFVSLLNDDAKGALLGLKVLGRGEGEDVLDFPPLSLIGTAPEIIDIDTAGSSAGMFRRRPGGNTSAAIAANLPASARGSLQDEHLPPVVAKRLIDTLQVLTKGAPRTCLDMLGSESAMEVDGADVSTPLERLLDLLGKTLYSKSATNLEQLLTMVESTVSPLSLLPKDGEQSSEITKRDLDASAAAGKEYVDIPKTLVSPRRLQLLCSLLRLESCRDSSFVKVNTIARRLCRVESNRTCILRELASVAQGLGADAIRDLRSLSIRLNDAVTLHREKIAASEATKDGKAGSLEDGRASTAVTLSTSSSEIKLLRVLQTLHVLCGELHDDSSKKHEGNHIFITQELVNLLQSIDLDTLWEMLSSCLRLVSVLEGVSHLDEMDEKKDDSEDRESDADQEDDETPGGGKKLQNSVVGLLTRFLPTIEAFFVVNASSVEEKASKESAKESSPEKTTEEDSKVEATSAAEGTAVVATTKVENDKDADIRMLVGGHRLVEFVGTNKVLLNALLRSNPSLLEKSLRAMVQVPRCRPFLDFDVKRHWFKSHVRKLRQHAGRRYGSLRLHIRRKHVFEDAFHHLQLRNADEMRGRLHITFRNEEGVDAGGLSREFFAILAKEMFNPNYALFTSTEDGCTFQPNPNSSINPDHLSYFRFVGRIVGKAVLDGFLLDAHFTRSLYKHMLGVKPTHHDMEAIDPDYYRNLKAILEHDLELLGLELTFSTDEHIFGRSQTIDLIENGSTIKVTEENKAKYVSLICQHRMTAAIKSQLKAFLEGFHELVKPDLISIFTAKELELLISGMPDIDVHDLKKNTDYNGYRAADKEIGWFWNIMFSLSRSEKAAFLQFVTGSSKVPLNGFSELQGMRGIQKFSIHKAGGSSGALMSAHTCFNSLDLPVYKSEEEMKEKLLYAINEGAGAFMFA